MAALPPINVDLLLVESGGPFFKVGLPLLLCRFKAYHIPDAYLDDACVSVVARERSGDWREYTQTVSAEQSREVVALMRELGIPGRTPDVEGVIDTSDGWSHLFLRVCSGEEETVLDIGMQCSGFHGADAEQLRVLFRRLFALAGYEGFCPVIYA